MIVPSCMLLPSLVVLLAFSFVRQAHAAENKTYHNPVLPPTDVVISLTRFDQ